MINREATIRWKGYDPDDLKPQSNKRVWANCDDCEVGRWVRYCDYSDLCRSCSSIIMQLPIKPEFVSEEDRFIPGTGIDRIKTIEELGYDPVDLSYGSGREVFSVCQNCGEGRWIKFCDYRDLCSLCSNKCKWDLPKPKFVEEKDRFIPGTGIDRITTIEKMGYDPIDLKSNSAREVWSVCRECNEGRRLKYLDYRDLCWDCSHYVLSTPDFVFEKDRFIPDTGIDRIITIEKMGYDPIDLVPGSGRRVWSVCRECNIGRWIDRCVYRDLCNNCSLKTEEYITSISGKNSHNWKGGISFGEYCEKFNEKFKEMIRDLFGRLCFLCGMDEEENGQKLSVHHTNYDKSCLCNSSCEFVPLCQKCHGKTNHNRKYWEDLIMCYLYPDRIIMIDI